mmetsp:Transcript_50585/g.145213  ORF Transcript_50585/g.145213 Transcript_50585/m.145213 type:complete len:233 (-) Transcript_50585:90-788(-)
MPSTVATRIRTRASFGASASQMARRSRRARGSLEACGGARRPSTRTSRSAMRGWSTCPGQIRCRGGERRKLAPRASPLISRKDPQKATRMRRTGSKRWTASSSPSEQRPCSGRKRAFSLPTSHSEGVCVDGGRSKCKARGWSLRPLPIRQWRNKTRLPSNFRISGAIGMACACKMWADLQFCRGGSALPIRGHAPMSKAYPTMLVHRATAVDRMSVCALKLFGGTCMLRFQR